jgi:hypothetical protein
MKPVTLAYTFLMTDQQLAAAVRRPDVHRKLLGSYRGAYSLGVTRAQGQPALLLRLEGETPPHVPASIVIDGEPVSVIVHGSFRAPQAL